LDIKIWLFKPTAVSHGKILVKLNFIEIWLAGISSDVILEEG
jgi:hypothetical protein